MKAKWDSLQSLDKNQLHTYTNNVKLGWKKKTLKNKEKIIKIQIKYMGKLFFLI